MDQTKEILKKRFDNHETNFTGTILVMSGHGGKDVNEKGFFCLETDKGDENLYYQQIVQIWKSRANPEKNKNLLIIVDAC